jgi:hypothetical protein
VVSGDPRTDRQGDDLGGFKGSIVEAHGREFSVHAGMWTAAEPKRCAGAEVDRGARAWGAALRDAVAIDE